MANTITGFYPGTTKKFSVLCKIDGVAQDITADALSFRIKENKADSDAEAELTKAADVATQGADGIALFVLAPADTTGIAFGSYYCDIVWTLAGGAEYVLYDNVIDIFERSSDE